MPGVAIRDRGRQRQGPARAPRGTGPSRLPGVAFRGRVQRGDGLSSENPMHRVSPTTRSRARLALAIMLGVSALVSLAAGPAEARSKRRLPPDVVLHPDRGMGITRFSKASHDQRLFKPLNEATRLPLRDAGIDPYNLVDRGVSTYDIQTGQIRGSLTDHYSAIRRGEETDRRNRQERARIEKATSPEGMLATLKATSAAARATAQPGTGSRPAPGSAAASPASR